MRFDQGSSQFVSANGLNADGVSSSSRQSLSSKERLPEAVLLARTRFLERLNGVSFLQTGEAAELHLSLSGGSIYFVMISGLLMQGIGGVKFLQGFRLRVPLLLLT